jgi:ABC-type Fe3+ transport system permease subunit
VIDASADGGGAVLFTSSAGAPASMPDVPPVTLDFNFLGRTWRLVVSPSQTLADETSAALLSRSLALGVPCTACAAVCSVLIAIFVRRVRREARDFSSFETYVRDACGACGV